MSKERYYVTTALPYANGPLHLGHLIEMIEADIWVRAKKNQGHSVYFACGNDAHGTPIMIQAQKQGLAPYDLVSHIQSLHKKTAETYDISFDYFGRTDSELNKVWCYKIYDVLKKSSLFKEKTIEQFFDPQAHMFLPDRFVKGVCPRCHSHDQNGDHCDACGATYTPLDLIDPYSILTKEKPVLRSVDHLFVDLEPYREWLKTYLPGKISDKIISKFQEWLDQPLHAWDITRDQPYYGIAIPDRPHQYFYVWFDAPIGYFALFEQIAALKNESLDDFYNPNSHLVHFIGKDISYFHGIFWPVMLKAAGLPLPSKIFVHGFLTLNHQKMSKSRGIVCDPMGLADQIPTDCLRYYLASKMQGEIDDLNFDVSECVDKINSDLVGKTFNILSRCSKLLFDYFDGKWSPDSLAQQKSLEELKRVVAHNYAERQYATSLALIMKELSVINEDLTKAAPWTALKQNSQDLQSWSVLTQALLTFFELVQLLEPVMPQLTAQMMSYHTISGLSKPYEIALQRLQKETIMQALTIPQAENIQENKTTAENTIAIKPIKDEITIDDFAKIDLRIGKVLECHAVEKSKLICMKIDIGSKVIQVFSGIKAYVTPEEMVGSNVVVCVNLAPRKMSVGVSEGMVLSASYDQNLTVLTTAKDSIPGACVS